MNRRLGTLTATLLILLSAVACGHPPAASNDVAVGLEPTSSPLSQAFAAELPATFSFTDRMGTALVATTEMRLTIDPNGAPATEFRAGDVGYRVSGRALVVFLSDSPSAHTDDVYLLGHVVSGLGDIAECVRDCRIAFTVPSAG